MTEKGQVAAKRPFLRENRGANCPIALQRRGRQPGQHAAMVCGASAAVVRRLRNTQIPNGVVTAWNPSRVADVPLQ